MPRRAPETRKYEMMVIVAPTVTEEGLPAAAERVAGYVTAQGGEIETYTHQNPWGHRRLAYEIQGFQDAFYVLYYFMAPTNIIAEIERQLGIDAQVIRHLIVKYDPLADSEYGRPRPQPSEGEESDAEQTAETAESTESAEEEAAPADETEQTDEAQTAEEE